MYDRTIPVFTRGLTAMSKILDKAEAHCAEKKIDPQVLLTERIYPDMLPFTRQIQIASDHARRCPARLTGAEPVPMEDTETTFAQLQDRIARTIDVLKGFDRSAFDGAADKTITLKIGGRDMEMSGSDYVGLMALPNFYFHLTTAHCILRMDGVVIGKTDFMGG